MRKRLGLLSACAVLSLILVASTGCSLRSNTAESTVSSSGSAAIAPDAQPNPGSGTPATAGSATDKGASQPADRMIVTNATMSLRVQELSAAIAALRTLTKESGGTVSELTVTDNAESPVPVETTADSSKMRFTGPANASLTLRVPAKSLPDVQTKIAGMGKLISQSSNESDVTQQHIDMSARLKNLRAEEVRLRALLDRAGKVSELLEVERELSRVRGEIESMAAQLAYLEGQAAMATLTVTLEQPGPVVRPSAGGWGLVDAVTSGVQGAALLVRELITAVIALSPLLLIGGLLWWLLARRARKRRAAREAYLAEQTDPTAADAAPDALGGTGSATATNAPSDSGLRG